jgi:hypothetical protein
MGDSDASAVMKLSLSMSQILPGMRAIGARLGLSKHQPRTPVAFPKKPERGEPESSSAHPLTRRKPTRR